MKKNTIFIGLCLFWVAALSAPSKVRADMYFEDGGLHVVDYAIAGDVYVRNNTELMLLTGGSVENMLYVGGGTWDEKSSVILDSGFVGDTVMVQGSCMPQMFPDVPHIHFKMLSGSVLNINAYGSEVNIYGGQILSSIWSINDKDHSIITIHGSNFQGTAGESGGPQDWRGYGPISYFYDYALLSGTLANGNCFNNWYLDFGDDMGLIQLVPVPPALLLGAIGLVISGLKLRKCA